MNKQGPKGIGWCDWTWNPYSGCWGPGGTAEKPNRCSYCYAEKVARRFYTTPGDIVDSGDPFAPTFHPDRLSQPAKVKKPSRIFVCSMADLFGDWVPSAWIEEILQNVRDCPQHTFQFLTKNPKRLNNFNGWWTNNTWVGTTVTNQADMDERGHWLLQVDAPVRFVSHEPLLGEILIPPVFINPLDWGEGPKHYPDGKGFIDWAIIGAMTGPGAVKPKMNWVLELIDQYKTAGVPIFLKDNLPWKGAKKIQEFPA